MVAIFGFDGGISIYDALDVGLIFETMERDNEVLPAAANFAGGRQTLPGVSKYSFNVIGLYELGPTSVRLAYNYRSANVDGFGAPAEFVKTRAGERVATETVATPEFDVVVLGGTLGIFLASALAARGLKARGEGV